MLDNVSNFFFRSYDFTMLLQRAESRGARVGVSESI